MNSLRVIGTSSVKYPVMENNWPGFYKETNLMHLAVKFKPETIREIVADLIDDENELDRTGSLGLKKV